MEKFEIKGLQLRTLKYLSTHEVIARNTFGTMHRHLAVTSRAEFDTEINLLEKTGLIEINTEQNSATYQLTKKGKEYIRQYNDFELSEIFSGNFDYVVLKFLFLMGEPVAGAAFPDSILQHTPPRMNQGLDKDYNLRSYIDFDSSLKTYVDTDNMQRMFINYYGKKYYEHLVIQNTRDTEIRNKPLVHLEYTDNSTNTIGDFNKVSTHSDVTTHGNNSPAAGDTLNMGDIKNNPIPKKSPLLEKFYWAGGIIIAIIALITIFKQCSS